jgi:hypothetical protein
VSPVHARQACLFGGIETPRAADGPRAVWSA